MIIGIPNEIHPGERRVAAAPDNVAKFIKLGYQVIVEAGAGVDARFPDKLYEEAKATVVTGAEELWSQSDIILKIRAPKDSEVPLLREGTTLISFIQPAQNPDLVEALRARNANVIAMDCIPRISRAQSMDALSSMANIAGYRAMVEAAHEFGRFFTGQITAAGRVPPAKVMVIGAGVAGLSAIGTARNMGAIVRAFDTRPAVKDEVASMGAEFLELEFEEDGTGEGGYAKTMSKEFIEAEMKLFAEQAREVDIIVTTAMIPGKKSPLLITEEMVKSMKDGSVIVDLASEGGGNCELSEEGQRIQAHGVTILGYLDLPGRLPTQASQLYGNNLFKLLQLLGEPKEYKIDFDDEVLRGATIIKDGEITWPPPKPAEPSPKPQPAKETTRAEAPKEKSSSIFVKPGFMLALACLALLGLAGIFDEVMNIFGRYSSQSGVSLFLHQISVFVLACFVGYMVIWNVTPALHTPLMSVTNAISGIIVIGGMLFISNGNPWLSGIAVLIATINIAGGFLVTQRMLKMFRK